MVNKAVYRMLSMSNLLHELAHYGEFLRTVQDEETIEHIKQVLDTFDIDYTLSRVGMDIKIRMKGSLDSEYTKE